MVDLTAETRGLLKLPKQENTLSSTLARESMSSELLLREKKYYFQDTYITKYYLEYMDRNGNWQFYNDKQEFDGNSDADTVKTNFFFDQPIHTRHLRIVVNDWEQQILLRAEVYSEC